MSEQDKDKIIEELRSEISILKSVLHKMPGNIYWKTRDDVFLGCNDNVAKILGLESPDEIVGKKGTDLIPAEIAEKTHQIDLKVIDLQKETSFEETGINAEGKHAIYLSRKSPFYVGKKKLAGIIGISVDITKQKQIEKKLKIAKRKAEAASRAKSQFLAMVSHELRIPLTSLLGFSNFLQDNNLSSNERIIYIEQLIRSGNYLLALINKLLDFSKLEADKTEVILEPINLQELVFDVKRMLTNMAAEKNLSLEVEYDANAPQYAMLDAHILQQILINLVGNAIKFTKTGSVTIRVVLLEKTDEMMKLKIAVQDTGIGIPVNKLKTIFKEFYQVEDIYTRSASMTGTGLGLAIVKKLIKLLKSNIEVKSKINEGSVFSFEISLAQVKSNLKKIFAEEKILLPQGSQVLLVEDEPLVQFVHKKMLTDLGCQVDLAVNGKTALELIHTDHKIIFVDIGLPDFTGFELIKQLTKLTAPLSKIPIIALTGFFTDEDKRRCLESGAKEVLVKPVSEHVLKEILVRYL